MMFPQAITAGDTFPLARSYPSYPASAGWLLHFKLVPRTPGATVQSFDATSAGDDYAVTVLASTTAGWGADVYTVVGWVTKDGESHTLERWQLVVLPDARQADSGYDGRSLAQKALDDCKAALASWKPTQRRYKIGEREMEFRSTAEIVQLITYWESQVNRETPGARPAFGGRIYTRL